MSCCRGLVKSTVHILVKETSRKNRLDLCRKCEFFIGNFCKKCKCFMPVKTRLAISKCPIGKWDSEPLTPS